MEGKKEETGTGGLEGEEWRPDQWVGSIDLNR